MRHQAVTAVLRILWRPRRGSVENAQIAHKQVGARGVRQRQIGHAAVIIGHGILCVGDAHALAVTATTTLSVITLTLGIAGR